MCSKQLQQNKQKVSTNMRQVQTMFRLLAEQQKDDLNVGWNGLQMFLQYKGLPGVWFTALPIISTMSDVDRM